MPDAGAADAAPMDGGVPDAHPDARLADLSCIGREPGTPPPTITLSGRIREDPFNMRPSRDVLVEIFPKNEMPPAIASTTTDASGLFSLMLTTGGQPLDVVARFTKTGMIPEWFYPAEPIDRSYSGVEGLIGSTDAFSNPLLALVFGTSYDPSRGLIALLVLDCDNRAIEGATVSLDPAPQQLRYAAANGIPNATQTETSTSGAVLGWNAPLGSTRVSGMVAGTPLKSHTITSHAGAISLTILHP